MKSNSNNSTIKAIARELNLSIGTVSIVLNGRGNEMRISEATQKRILDYAKEIDYQPNLYARRLRKVAHNNLPIIAVFCAAFNPFLISRFFDGVLDYKKTAEEDVEIMLHPFTVNELEKHKEFLSSIYYHGAIIMGLSEKDLEFVNNSSFDIPIVLLNRSTEIYSSVCVDDYGVGQKVASIFAGRGHKRVSVMTYGRNSSRAADLRLSGFLSSSLQYRLELPPGGLVDCESSYEGGKYGAKQLVEKCRENMPTALFIQDCTIACGALRAFHDAGIRIPEDMEIITYGDNTMDNYTIPSLTSIHSPLEKMSTECIEIVVNIIKGSQKKKTCSIHPVSVVIRESCGEEGGTFIPGKAG